MEMKNVWETYNTRQLKELESLNAQYREFLSQCKTERECVDYIVNAIEDAGYQELSDAIKTGKKLKKGDKVYAVCMNKSVVMFHIGERPMAEGMNILGAHIDSPRLDVKQNPLYEDGGFAYLDTHYYGGVKKYQWVTIPLAIHGVVIKKDGTTIEVNVGENEDDPVFFISDLLIHLAQEQMEKKASKVIEGEALDLIIGNKPISLGKGTEKEESAGKDAVKKGILSILKETYDMEEEDFISAELEVVPAGKAREAGFDRSMILSYGQDDRVCAFTSLKAMLEMKSVERTACCLLVDKEEIGSVGATGMQSHEWHEHAVQPEDVRELTPVREHRLGHGERHDAPFREYEHEDCHREDDCRAQPRTVQVGLAGLGGVVLTECSGTDGDDGGCDRHGYHAGDHDESPRDAEKGRPERSGADDDEVPLHHRHAVHDDGFGGTGDADPQDPLRYRPVRLESSETDVNGHPAADIPGDADGT